MNRSFRRSFVLTVMPRLYLCSRRSRNAATTLASIDARGRVKSSTVRKEPVMDNLPPPITSVAALHAPCKCCGQSAELYGVVDFHKNCNVLHGQILPLSGIPIYYHRCAACEFLFTTAFDHFSPGDFSRHIYNAEYIVVDPEYLALRPDNNAAHVAQLLGNNKSIRILDFGGGNGRLTTRLRLAGFTNVQTYDPFVPTSAKRPVGQFDLVLSFEVAEHSPTPRQTFADITSFLSPHGVVHFSTLVQPAKIDQIGVNWWYVAPRNGHVSIFSRKSLQVLANSFGFNLGSFSDDLHVLARQLPPFAANWASGIKTPQA
jgi:SAM-dependent methyltransferase